MLGIPLQVMQHTATLDHTDPYIYANGGNSGHNNIRDGAEQLYGYAAYGMLP